MEFLEGNNIEIWVNHLHVSGVAELTDQGWIMSRLEITMTKFSIGICFTHRVNFTDVREVNYEIEPDTD